MEGETADCESKRLYEQKAGMKGSNIVTAGEKRDDRNPTATASELRRHRSCN